MNLPKEQSTLGRPADQTSLKSEHQNSNRPTSFLTDEEDVMLIKHSNKLSPTINTNGNGQQENMAIDLSENIQYNTPSSALLELDVNDDEELISQEELALQERRLHACSADLENSKVRFSKWMQSQTKRRMFALAHLRKLIKIQKNRLKFYDDVTGLIASEQFTRNESKVSDQT